MKLGKKVAEGKTKIILENLDDPTTQIMFFKNTITAGDGAKKDVIVGKGKIDRETHVNIMEYLKRRGIRNMTFLSLTEDGYCLLRKIDKMLPLEIITRGVATGSALDLGYKEGHRFDPLLSQIFYKDDFLHDPLLDAKYLKYLERKKDFLVYRQAKELSEEIFLLLEEAFARQYHQYIDHKIEVGLIFNGKNYDPSRSELVLADEITAGSMRVWPYTSSKPNLNKKNILNELNKKGMKDKQLYRDGKSLDEVKKGFEEILEMTKKF